MKKSYVEFLPLKNKEIKEGDYLFFHPFGYGRAVVEYETLCYKSLSEPGIGSLTSPLRNLKNKHPYELCLCNTP